MPEEARDSVLSAIAERHKRGHRVGPSVLAPVPRRSHSESSGWRQASEGSLGGPNLSRTEWLNASCSGAQPTFLTPAPHPLSKLTRPMG
jgi:hypothetical protein